MYFIVTLKNKEEKKLKKCKKLKKTKKKKHSKINYRPGHKWRPTQREYEWRPGTSKKNYRLGHPDTNHDREYKWRPGRRDTTTTGTPGAQAGYIIDDWDTGIVWIEITDRDTGTQMTTGTLGHREYKCYLYAQTMGQRRMLYIRMFYVVKNIYLYLYLFTGGTQGYSYNDA